MKVTASLLTAFLFLMVPFTAMSVAGQSLEDEGVPNPTSFDDGTFCDSALGGACGIVDGAWATPLVPDACDEGQDPSVTEPCIPGGAGALCPEPVTGGSDPIWQVMCSVATGLGATPTGEDHDGDGRVDTYRLDLPTGTIVLLPDAEEVESDWICDDPALPWACYDPSASTPVYLQADFFFTDDDPATPDEWYGLVGGTEFDIAADVMVYWPDDGTVLNGGNAQRVSNIFEHTADARFGPMDFALSVYKTDDAGPDGGYCYICIDPSGSIVFGFGSSEGILELTPQPGSDYPHQWDNGETTFVFDYPGDQQLGGPAFADGRTLGLNDLHFKPTYFTDLDDDGDTDLAELLCSGANPTNPESTCDDKDGDGLNPDSDDFSPFDADPDGDGVDDFDGTNPAGDDGKPKDNCPTTANPNQENHDGDSLGDACDPDDDNDGVNDADDDCPLGDTSNPADHDNDGCGDDAVSAEANEPDADDDNDGIDDDFDTCDDSVAGTYATWTSTPASDNDQDGCKDDAEDNNDDNDAKLDNEDNCPLVANDDQADLDNDGTGDACDNDADGDGFPKECPSASGPTAPAENGLNGALDTLLGPECQEESAAADLDADDQPAPNSGLLGGVLGSVPPVPSPDSLSPGGALNGFIYPECDGSEDQPDDPCDNDPLDQRDHRDVDDDGNTAEATGQIDLVEERLFYFQEDYVQNTGEADYLLQLTVISPGFNLAAPPEPMLRIRAIDPVDVGTFTTPTQEWLLIEQFDGTDYCIYADGRETAASPIGFGTGATPEEACENIGYDRIDYLNGLGAGLGSDIGSFLYAGEGDALPLFELTDADGNGIPEVVTINLLDPLSCAPVMGTIGPAPAVTGAECSGYAEAIEIPLGGVPGIPGVPDLGPVNEAVDTVVGTVCPDGPEAGCGLPTDPNALCALGDESQPFPDCLGGLSPDPNALCALGDPNQAFPDCLGSEPSNPCETDPETCEPPNPCEDPETCEPPAEPPVGEDCTGEPGVFEICEGTGFFSTLGPFPLVKVKILGITVNL